MVVTEVGTTECFHLCAEGEIKGPERKGRDTVTGQTLNQIIRSVLCRKI